ncbi:hypothetical protein GEMRC1_011350 [Eukaryota sp. GEM-RC1]
MESPLSVPDTDTKFGEHQKQLFQKRLDDLDAEIDLLLKGEHPDYKSELEVLLARRDEKIANAEQHKQYMIQVVSAQHSAEVKSLNDQFESGKEEAQNDLLQKLRNKHSQLSSEIANITTYEEPRQLRKKRKEAINPVKRKSGLSLNQIVTDGEIAQDLILIQHSLEQKA